MPGLREAPRTIGLDIGCGSNKAEGFIGMDRIPLAGVDVVFDFDAGAPWPFEDNSFEMIRAIHVVEHIADPLHFFAEMHRVARPACRVRVETPHFSSSNSWNDPTHVHHYGSDFLDVIANGYLAHPAPRFKITAKSLRFSGLLHTWPGWLIARLSLRKYEKYYAWRYPASAVVIEAEVLK